jgi:hypothetical protein
LFRDHHPPPAWNCYGAPRLYRGIWGSARRADAPGWQLGGGVHNVNVGFVPIIHPTREGLGRQVEIEIEVMGEKAVGCLGKPVQIRGIICLFNDL